MNFYYSTISFFSLLISVSAFAAKPIVLTDALEEKVVSREFVDYWVDSTATFGIEQLIKLEKSSRLFKPSVFPDLTNENTSAAYWLRFEVVNNSKKPFRVELFDFNINEIYFYYKNQNGDVLATKAGFQFPFHLREIKHKNVSFNLYLKQNDTCVYYFRFKSLHKNVLEPVVRSYDKSIGYGLNEYLFLGAFYGLLAFMIFYNLLYFILLRKLHYLYFLLYVSGILIYQMSQNGTGFQYLWPNRPGLNIYMDNIGQFVCVSGLLFFAINFWELKTQFQNKRNILLVAFWVRVLLFLFQMVYPIGSGWEIVDLFYVQMVLIVGIVTYHSGHRPAKWYVVGFAILNITFLISWAEHLGWVESNVCTVYALNLGIVVQCIFLSISIGESIQETYRQKNEAQGKLLVEYKRNDELKEKINQELEQKVKERTQELEERNAEIEKQRDEIDAINDHLEDLVKERTKELEDRNSRIREYAFSNSHLARGPLARILGLAEVAKHCPENTPEILGMMDENAKELDQVIREMTSILAEKTEKIKD